MTHYSESCEEKHCTVITYQDEEQQAFLGKSILPEPLTTHYNNAQFITIKSRQTSSSYVYTIGGVQVKQPIIQRIELTSYLIRNPKDAKWEMCTVPQNAL